MNRETDRVTVPTNGRKPRAVAKALVGTSGPGVPPDPGAADAPTRREPIVKATSPELTIAVTPAQFAVGFGVIAGIILLLFRRRGRRKE